MKVFTSFAIFALMMSSSIFAEEHQFGDKGSLEVGGGIAWNFESSESGEDYITTTKKISSVFTPTCRYYFLPKIFVGPSFSIEASSTKTEDNTMVESSAKQILFNMGAEFGGSLINKSVFTPYAGLRGQFAIGDSVAKDAIITQNEVKTDISGFSFGPFVGCKIGFTKNVALQIESSYAQKSFTYTPKVDGGKKEEFRQSGFTAHFSILGLVF